MTRNTSTSLLAGAVVVTGIFVLGTASSAYATETLMQEKTIAVDNCSVVGSGQLCPSPANLRDNWASTTQFTAPSRARTVKVEFTASPDHCSDIVAHIFVNGSEWGSNTVGPGQSDGGYEVPVNYGLNQIQVQAEGVTGGCNTGALSSWGGVLRIFQLT
jgi:hypothetical protein